MVGGVATKIEAHVLLRHLRHSPIMPGLSLGTHPAEVARFHAPTPLSCPSHSAALAKTLHPHHEPRRIRRKALTSCIYKASSVVTLTTNLDASGERLSQLHLQGLVTHSPCIVESPFLYQEERSARSVSSPQSSNQPNIVMVFFFSWEYTFQPDTGPSSYISMPFFTRLQLTSSSPQTTLTSLANLHHVSVIDTSKSLLFISFHLRRARSSRLFKRCRRQWRQSMVPNSCMW